MLKKSWIFIILLLLIGCTGNKNIEPTENTKAMETKDSPSYVLNLSNGDQVPFQEFRAFTFDDMGEEEALPITEHDEEKVIRVVSMIRMLEEVDKGQALQSAPDEGTLMLQFGKGNEFYMYDSNPMRDGKFYYTFYTNDDYRCFVSDKDLIKPIMDIVKE
ncbi:MAG: hypothetical protein Q4Q07_03155 [Tissierellia bacterium]|nr:hypothetical protein [Tissierellia bacterium]